MSSSRFMYTHYQQIFFISTVLSDSGWSSGGRADLAADSLLVRIL